MTQKYLLVERSYRPNAQHVLLHLAFDTNNAVRLYLRHLFGNPSPLLPALGHQKHRRCGQRLRQCGVQDLD